MKTAMQVNVNGATVRGAQVEFRVWAPAARRVTLKLWHKGAADAQEVELRRLGSSDFGMPDLAEEADADTWEATVDASAGELYQYMLNGEGPSLPDPVSRHLPEGVHGRTEIVDPSQFRWTDAEWRGLPLEDYVIYEMHVGTFTPGGTFDSAIEKLDYIKQLGATVIEVMPVNAFPGTRNWGYDGVGFYAVQTSYGGPERLRRFVDAAHKRGLAVILDVVYNHVGNEGNYLRNFGPYFTDKHSTPWGDALNYDDIDACGVRRFVVENALYWLREYHLDGLRMDAVQNIKDDSEQHIVAEVAAKAHELGRELGRTIVVTCETDENDRKYVVAPPEGYGADAMWSDDFHHALHVMLTGEKAGYYQDFGAPELVTRTLNEGWAFQGEHFNFWKDNRGTSAAGVPLPANIICIQNHDQVGNRAKGERLTHLMSRGARKLLAAVLLLAPETPLLFMGQEYDEQAPFQFFTDYGDPVLQKAVSEGRRNEFKDFDFSEVPDPQDPATFERSRLTWKIDEDMLSWYRELLKLRRIAFGGAERTCDAEWVDTQLLKVQVPARAPRLILAAGFTCELRWKPGARWDLALESNEDNFCVRIFRRQ